MNYTYIVECKDGTLYTGWTNNLEKRIADHNSGKGAKYTRARKPVTLVYYETFEAKEEAMKREYAKIDRTFSYTLRIFYIIIGFRCIFAKRKESGKYER